MSTTPKSDAAYALNEPVQLYEQCRELELELAELREARADLFKERDFFASNAVFYQRKSGDLLGLIERIVQFDEAHGLPISQNFRDQLRETLHRMPPTGDKTVPSSIPYGGHDL